MRVRDQLVYLGRLHGMTKPAAGDAADHWTERLGVAERRGDRLEKLSLGNQQRVQLAAALVHDPEVLVLDEPFSGLDPVGVDTLSGVLQEVAAKGVPVVFSSHQLDLVERVCDGVAIINAGRLVAAGQVEELRDARSQRLYRVVVAGADARWARALPGVTVNEQDGGGVLLLLEDSVDDQAVLDAARAAGPVRHFEIVRPTLTELFREAVQA
jgi:ABC-2 type transport system ATP-binding protein